MMPVDDSTAISKAIPKFLIISSNSSKKILRLFRGLEARLVSARGNFFAEEMSGQCDLCIQ